MGHLIFPKIGLSADRLIRASLFTDP